MLNTFNLNNLYYFYVIAKEGSLKEASVSLHVTQPSLTYQVKSLEKFLGTKLFEKQGRNIVLNSKGKLVLDYCNKIFPQCQELVDVVKFKHAKELEYIAIGVIPSISTKFLADLVSNVLKTPNLKISVVENEFKNMLSSLSSGEIDIILSDFKIENLPKTIRCEKYLEREFVFACDKKIKFKSKKFEDQIRKLRFINYTHESAIHNRILHYFEKKKWSIDIVAEIDDIELLKRMLLSSNFCAVIPTFSLLEDSLKSNFRVLETFPNANQSIYLYIRDENDKPILKKVLSVLKGFVA
ncbi:MAG: LysR family transcriptional regulator [Halobacteriovoraceae bacterium]|nr:LysR family transcriptional regulator [Halobacteriovoraceae bacterium]